jgi:hypothetical protein
MNGFYPVAGGPQFSAYFVIQFPVVFRNTIILATGGFQLSSVVFLYINLVNQYDSSWRTLGAFGDSRQTSNVLVEGKREGELFQRQARQNLNIKTIKRLHRFKESLIKKHYLVRMSL